jgi:hypothetical protein
MLEYGQFLVLVFLTGWVVLVLAWGVVMVGDYAMSCYLKRVEQWQKIRTVDYE